MMQLPGGSQSPLPIAYYGFMPWCAVRLRRRCLRVRVHEGWLVSVGAGVE
mgnify:CR=1 FL=1